MESSTTKEFVFESLGEKAYVEVSSEDTLAKVRELILEELDSDQFPSGDDTDFGFKVNGIGISTKQESKKKAFVLLDKEAKVELIPRSITTKRKNSPHAGAKSPPNSVEAKRRRLNTSTPVTPTTEIKPSMESSSENDASSPDHSRRNLVSSFPKAQSSPSLTASKNGNKQRQEPHNKSHTTVVTNIGGEDEARARAGIALSKAGGFRLTKVNNVRSMPGTRPGVSTTTVVNSESTTSSQESRDSCGSSNVQSRERGSTPRPDTLAECTDDTDEEPAAAASESNPETQELQEESTLGSCSQSTKKALLPGINGLPSHGDNNVHSMEEDTVKERSENNAPLPRPSVNARREALDEKARTTRVKEAIDTLPQFERLALWCAVNLSKVLNGQDIDLGNFHRDFWNPAIGHQHKLTSMEALVDLLDRLADKDLLRFEMSTQKYRSTMRHQLQWLERKIRLDRQSEDVIRVLENDIEKEPFFKGIKQRCEEMSRTAKMKMRIRMLPDIERFALCIGFNLSKALNNGRDLDLERFRRLCVYSIGLHHQLRPEGFANILDSLAKKGLLRLEKPSVSFFGYLRWKIRLDLPEDVTDELESGIGNKVFFHRMKQRCNEISQSSARQSRQTDGKANANGLPSHDDKDDGSVEEDIIKGSSEASVEDSSSVSNSKALSTEVKNAIGTLSQSERCILCLGVNLSKALNGQGFDLEFFHRLCTLTFRLSRHFTMASCADTLDTLSDKDLLIFEDPTIRFDLPEGAIHVLENSIETKAIFCRIQQQCQEISQSYRAILNEGGP